jgi:hypothetical protein
MHSHHHRNGSTQAARTNAAAPTPTFDSDTVRRGGALVRTITAAVVTALMAACEPNPNPSPVPRLPTPTPAPNRNPEPPVNPRTLSVTSTQILVDRTVRCETHRRLSV